MSDHSISSLAALPAMLAVLVLALLLPLGLVASEADHESGHESGHDGAGAHHGKHTIGLFVGVTREHGENLETFGLEYSYRIRPRWTIGALIERAEREQDSTLGIVFAAYWPWKGLYLGAGVGRKDPANKRENTARVSAGYEWVFDSGWLISAQAHLDFIENHDREEVFGLVFGHQF